MNVFSTLKNGPFELTKEDFVRETKKDFPYFQTNKKRKEYHYAICPECHNPVIIINLFGENLEEKHTKRRNTHARHSVRNINGFPNYSQLRYSNCPLHNAESFSCQKIREDELINNDLYDLINNNISKIIKDIRYITGINFNTRYLQQLIEVYLNTKNYCYLHTHKYNIPYSILYTSHSLDIYGRYLLSSYPISYEIEKIIKNSPNFNIKEAIDDKEKKSKQIVRNTNLFSQLKLSFTNHRLHENSMQLSIYEIINNDTDNATCLGKITINLKPFFYPTSN